MLGQAGHGPGSEADLKQALDNGVPANVGQWHDPILMPRSLAVHQVGRKRDNHALPVLSTTTLEGPPWHIHRMATQWQPARMEKRMKGWAVHQQLALNFRFGQ